MLGPILFPFDSSGISALPFTGWFRASYTASQWNGTASAGTSASHAFAFNSSSPLVGTAVNGYTPALYQTSTLNDLLGATTADSDQWISTSGFTAIALFKLTSATTAGSNILNSPNLIFDANIQSWGLAYDSNGVTFWLSDGTTRTVTVAAALSTWNVAMAYYDGSSINLSVNNGAWSTFGGIGTVQSAPGTIESGNAAQGFSGLNGSILELLTSNVVLSRSYLSVIGKYMQRRYSLSLGF